MIQLITRAHALGVLAAGVVACCAVLAQSQKKDQKLDPAVLSDAPNVPQMVVDSDGTLHFGSRTVPLPALASPEARRAYTRQMLQQGQSSAARGGLASVRVTETDAAMPITAGGSKAALKIYLVVEESQRIGGVGVTIYSPKTIPSQNRNKVAMEFEMDAEAIAVASLGQLKQKPPLPGKVGLGTCSGGSNPGDARYTLNGLDAGLSTAFSGRPPFWGRETAARAAGDRARWRHS